MKNSRLRLRNLLMYCDVALVRHQHLRISLRTHLVDYHVTLRKRHRLVVTEDHPFENGYDKSTLSYEKELRNKRVVAKVK